MKIVARGMCGTCYRTDMYAKKTTCTNCDCRINSCTRSKLCRRCSRVRRFCLNEHDRLAVGIYSNGSCKECHRQNGRHRANRKIEAIQLKGGVCVDCGMNFEGRPECAEFDHICGRKENPGQYSMMNMAWEKVLLELEKTELVCANCHATRTKQRSLGVPRPRKVRHG